MRGIVTLPTNGALAELSRPWCFTAPAVATGLVVAVAPLTMFAIGYHPFDFNVYRWGGSVVTSGMRLYDVQVEAHWFTYPPFAR
jgi:hypothetical protein